MAGRTDHGREWAQAMNRTLLARPETEHVSIVIDLMKYPTVAGIPDDVLLSGLHARFADAPAEGARLRELVAWVKKRFPELASKLGQPPVRPVRS